MKSGGKRARKPAPIWKLVLMDVALFIVALLVFALFHHVIPRQGRAVGLTSQRVSSATATPAPEYSATPEPATPEPATPEPTEIAADAEAAEDFGLPPTQEPTAEPTQAPAPTPEPTAEPVGYFGSKFADKFIDGEPELDEHNYRSRNINVTVSREIFGHSFCYIADIYIRDISCFQSVFGRDTYGRGYYETPRQIAKRVNSVVLINGDYYGTHDNGVVVRNGTLYRDDPNTEWDVGVLYWDGTVETFSPQDFDVTAEMARGAYQVWNFGPGLLDAEGKPQQEFNSRVGGYCNPRTALGYFEPGHYCFVVVDGRSSRSSGLTMEDLAQLMYELGCKRAYNLDGGQSSMMVAMDTTVNDPFRGGRAVSDVLAIVEPDGEGVEQ